MNPLNRARFLAKKVINKGAILFSNTEAIYINGSQIETNRGVITCRRVIVAIDGKLEVLFPELKARMRTTRL